MLLGANPVRTTRQAVRCGDPSPTTRLATSIYATLRAPPGRTRRSCCGGSAIPPPRAGGGTTTRCSAPRSKSSSPRRSPTLRRARRRSSFRSPWRPRRVCLHVCASTGSSAWTCGRCPIPRCRSSASPARPLDQLGIRYPDRCGTPASHSTALASGSLRSAAGATAVRLRQRHHVLQSHPRNSIVPWS